MPPLVSALLLKFVLPGLIQWARQRGYINLAEDLAAKGALALANEIKDAKAYPIYPTGKNGQTDSPPVATGQENSNINR